MGGFKAVDFSFPVFGYIVVMSTIPASLAAKPARNPRCDVFRAVYLPALSDIPYGGILYLNRITSTEVSAFDDPAGRCIGAVSVVGLREIDAALQNLLLREKADRLCGAPHSSDNGRPPG